MAELEDALYQRVLALSKEGKSLEAANDFVAAKAKFFEALKLIPQPHQDWSASTWLYTYLGDMHFKLQAFEKCLMCFLNAVQCPGGLSNPFIHLRIRQMYFEQGDLETSADELTRAYMGGGIEILLEDDPKYLEFLETKIKL